MMAEVVNLYDAPPLNDIPGQLRHMADMIERGEVETNCVIFIADTDEEWPQVYGWGDNIGGLGNIGILEWTKAFLISQLTA